ncbi:MAG TPA: aminoglycoside phosphotransferase family protein, partial [Chlamydiales bacterium]|nr:aminoglycoside phosphotransferase family protein [Chlamydiales bacterium]
TALMPHMQLASCEIISGGCANLNIKINFKEDAKPYILRVYLRDKDAAYREQKIAQLLHGLIPLPQVYCIGDYNAYRFAITEYRSGITLRDLLLGNQSHDVGDMMYDVGMMLASIHSSPFAPRFPTSGFFDKELNIAQKLSQEGFVFCVKDSLQHKTVKEKLRQTVIAKIEFFLEKFGHLYPGEKDNHLVHADFDPANIFMQQVNGEWKIAAILDWEFAFSGSMLCDMANMLRYAHHMPEIYTKGFLQGLQDGGVCLPNEWQIRVHMLNILSLLQCLVHCPPEERPNQCKDICELMVYIIDELEAS